MPEKSSLPKEPSLTEPVAARPIAEVVEWTKEAGEGSRLFLPPIQRSAVWRNSQIINYWDSLLRGYPAGMMMVHHPKAGATEAQDLTTNRVSHEIRANDFMLFDGQQRLTAILLGLGEGQLQDRLKLWVDLGAVPEENSDLKFVLRISSTGQPFGYKADEPNAKFELPTRRSKAEAWMKTKDEANKAAQMNAAPNARAAARPGVSQEAHFDSGEAFAEARGKDLIHSVCALPLSEVVQAVQDAAGERGKPALEVLGARLHEGLTTKVKEQLMALVQAVERVLSLQVVFQLIAPQVIEEEQEYIRFFGRLGQGGTALSNDELTYSIIKHHFPEVHDCMRSINKGDAGRMGGEVNLVLAALRLAKVRAPWKTEPRREWEIFVRPYPAFVTRLKTELTGVREEFLRLMALKADSTGRNLKGLLEGVRKRLAYNAETNPAGLPVMLLTRLPHALMDVLLLMETEREAQDTTPGMMPAFTLYWLLFVNDPEKAANTIFERRYRNEPDWLPAEGMGAAQKLIRYFEEVGISPPLPGVEHLHVLRDEIKVGTHVLRSWEERFAALNVDKDCRMGETVRNLASHRRACCDALLWLQREYLTRRYPNYDPSSGRDEDLPIDLDHAVPSAKFGFHWKSCGTYLDFVDEKENFRHLRGLVGNSLGNLRWLDASDNRKRQDGPMEMEETAGDGITDREGWNRLITGGARWTTNDVTTFQRMIDQRTVAIYETLLRDGGLGAFAIAPGAAGASASA